MPARRAIWALLSPPSSFRTCSRTGAAPLYGCPCPPPTTPSPPRPPLAGAPPGAWELPSSPRPARGPPPPVSQPPCLLCPRLRPEAVLRRRLVPDLLVEALHGLGCVLDDRRLFQETAEPAGVFPEPPGDLSERVSGCDQCLDAPMGAGSGDLRARAGQVRRRLERQDGCLGPRPDPPGRLPFGLAVQDGRDDALVQPGQLGGAPPPDTRGLQLPQPLPRRPGIDIGLRPAAVGDHPPLVPVPRRPACPAGPLGIRRASRQASLGGHRQLASTTRPGSRSWSSSRPRPGSLAMVAPGLRAVACPDSRRPASPAARWRASCSRERLTACSSRSL